MYGFRCRCVTVFARAYQQINTRQISDKNVRNTTLEIHTHTHTPCSLHELTAVSVLAEAAVYEIQRRQERPTHPQQLQPVREQHQQHHQQGPPALSPPTRIQRSFDDEPNKNIRKDFRERFTSQETKFHPYTALCPRRRLLLSLRTAITIAHLV